jgi:predicted Holliday junction resolvase-like endonuclease
MAPFLANFPYDPKQAHFLGMPVDYVVFTDDEVVFLEVKSGQAVLSKRQQQIKDLILKGKVSWKEYRISGKVPILPIINARWDPDYWTTA